MPQTSEGTGFQKTDTSALAALEVDGAGRADSLRRKVYAALLASPAPMSTEDLCAALGEDPASLQPRTSELREAGRIEDSGARGTSRFGRPCILWRAIQRDTVQTPNPREVNHV